MQLRALFRLGFPPAPRLLSLNLAAHGDSQAHSTKGTPPPSRAVTACGSAVSGSLSLPSRGPFHLSLTVLCAIGSRHVSSLGGWSPLLPAGFLVPRRTQAPPPRPHRFRLRGSHPLRPAFPGRSASDAVSHLARPDRRAPRRLQPRMRSALTLMRAPGLGSSPFARRYLGNLV